MFLWVYNYTSTLFRQMAAISPTTRTARDRDSKNLENMNKQNTKQNAVVFLR